jgi:signal transduction histidine kinase
MARLALGEKVYHEYRIKRKDGKVIWLEGKVTPSLDKHGKLIRLDGVVADISRRKKAERQLNDKVNDLNTFIYKASHDLGAPLASMMGLIHLAEQENRNTEVKEYLGLVKVSLDKMTNLLKDLVSTASISQDKLTVEEIEFRPIVSQIHNAIKYSEEFSGIKFTTDIPEATGFRTDKRFLYPILSNLIMNAMKYRKNGKESYIRIGIREDVKGVVIQVKDNGVGIQGEIQDKIFNMFFRGTQSSKGSGLGLYIVKTAVEKLQGKITVESELRVGTTFTVFLPSLHVPAENHPLPRAADKISKVSLKTFSGLSD